MNSIRPLKEMKTMAEKWTLQQEKAIADFGHNILVSAGAGSGKTAVLTDRVYRHVGQRKININELLVLTFTNKAAAEMKDRIRKKIISDEEGLFADEEEKKTQINKIDSSHIMTFDAYALFLVKKYHYLLGTDKDMRIIDRNILEINGRKILDEIMNEMYGRQDKDFTDLISTYCVRDDRNIRSFVMELNRKLEMIYERDEYVNTYSERFYTNEALGNTVTECARILKEKIRELDECFNELSECVENVADFYTGIYELKAAETYDEIREAVRNCQSTGKRLPNGSGAGDIKKKINKLLEDLNASTVNDHDELLKELKSAERYELCLLKLAEELETRMNGYKKENEMYSFIDIFKMAIRLLDENPEIKEEIKNGFKEILIDEYQDTNDLQDEFIRRIADDNVYMVGDIKQSIYRFRNANPKLFMDRYRHYKENDGGELIELSHNFRSRKEIIEDINVVFDRLMDEKIGGANYAAAHHMICGRKDNEIPAQNNHIEIRTYDPEDRGDYDSDEAEAFVIARDIQNKVGKFIVEDNNVLRPAEYRDFCVIIDRGNSFDLYRKIFTYLNIPSFIEREEKMKDSDLISVIRAAFMLLKCISEEDYGYTFRYAWLSLARSFVSDLNDKQIYEIFRNEGFQDSDICKKIMTIAEGISFKSISMILDEIIEVFDIYKRIFRISDVHENLVKIDYLYQLSHTLNSIGYNYKDLISYLDEIFEDNERGDIEYSIDKGDENAVRIINIHKSKGLQYRICYYPGLNVRFNDSELRSSFVFSRRSGIIIPVMVKDRGLRNSIRKLLYIDEYQEDDIGEKLRLLYVALTRSMEKIIMVTPLEDHTEKGKIVSDLKRKQAGCFKDLLEYVYRDLDDHGFIVETDLNDLGLSRDYRSPLYRPLKELVHDTDSSLLMKQPVHVEAVEQEKSRYSKEAGLIAPETLKVMELGTRLHYYLETIDFKDIDLSFVEEKYRDMIRAFFDSELMKDVKNGKAYKEYEFVYEEDNEVKHGFIDLLMEYDDHFDIIDYKTKNIDDEHYDEQLNGYRRYIRSVSDKDVYCYLYSIMDGGYREVKE